MISSLKLFSAKLKDLPPRHKIAGAVAFLFIFILLKRIFFHPVILPVEPVVPTVQVVKSVAKSYSPSLQLTATTLAMKHVTIRAEVTGQVFALSCDKGQNLKKGQSLFQIVDEDRSARLAEAKARVLQREAEFKAASQLSAKSFKSENSLLAIKADLEAAKANFSKMTLEIEKLELKAPFDGYYEQRFVEVGDFVNIGDKLASVVELNPLKLIAYVSQNEISSIYLGQKALVNVTGFKENFAATVSYISKVAEPKTHTFAVELTLENSQGVLSDGMTANVAVEKKPVKGHNLPLSTLMLNDVGILGVKILEEANKAIFHPVDVLDKEEKGHYIVAGLPDDIAVITVGGEFVRTGSIVKPTFIEPS